MKLAELNHLLIPRTKSDRDRLRNSLLGRSFAPFASVAASSTPTGRAVVGLTLFAGMLVLGLDVDKTQAHVAFAGLSGLLLACIVGHFVVNLQAVTVVVHAPRRAQTGERVQFAVSVTNHGTEPVRALQIRRPFLPWDGSWVDARPSIAELAPDTTTQAVCEAVFIGRGEHHLDAFEAAALAPFGLTLGRPVASGDVRLTVVPRIAPIARVTTPTTRKHHPGGVALASKTGESMDLLGVRPYRPGDPMRALHARSWAKRGAPVVREYEEEYFTRLGVIVDCDGTVSTPSQLEAALSLAAGIMARLSRGEALIDLLVVGDTVHPLTIGRSLGHLDQALDRLACVTSGPKLDGERLLSRLAPHLSKLSAVLFVAFAWDPTRRAIAARIQRQGVGCQTFVVTRRGVRARPRSDEGVTEVTELAIAGEEPLVL
ncbi:MAG: DUF58 domain-containing protein [Deltaproteobacteria bacterium]|nr:DUF58 domain-containing protein [Deltaproteobacteria bacterium]